MNTDKHEYYLSNFFQHCEHYYTSSLSSKNYPAIPSSTTAANANNEHEHEHEYEHEYEQACETVLKALEHHIINIHEEDMSTEMRDFLSSDKVQEFKSELKNCGLFVEIPPGESSEQQEMTHQLLLEYTKIRDHQRRAAHEQQMEHRRKCLEELIHEKSHETKLSSASDDNVNVNVNVNANADIHNRLSTSGEMSMSTAEMEVYIEDSSGNGTLVNNITLLRKNERRILHTGDTICLINPKIIQKKMRNALLQKKIIEHYSFVFINTHQTQRGATATHTMGNISSGLGMGTIVQSSIDGNHNHNHNHNYNHNSNNKAAQTRTPISSRIGIRSCQQPSTTSSRKRGLVDVKGTKSIQRPTGTGTSTLAIDMMMPPPDKKLKIHYYSSSEFTSKPKSKPKSMGQSKSSLRQLEAEYDLRDELGSGTCGLVRRAIHRKSGKMVAVKIIAIGGAGGRNRSVLSSKKFEIDPIIQAEANILKQLDHPYIVKLVDMFINPGKAVYLVMELLHGGDLFDRIVSKGRYTEVESRRVTRRMLAAVHYLHVDRDVVHRDLKPENILCVSQQDNITVKLTDFGLAKSITDDGLKTFCGTPQYFAPEVLRRQNTVAGRGRYGKEADMWSLGIILYILLSGIPPFDGSDMDAVAAAKISFGGSRWEGISDSAKDLIRQMLAIDANKRISVVDSCSHEWIMTQDGDTHVYPLDDPAIQRVIKAKDKVHTRSEVNKTPEQQNTTQPKPQSIITENLSPGPTTDIRPCSAKEKTLAANQDNKSDEIPTPNQSANFATSPIDGPGITESPKKQRESLFSFVKQLSDESACIRMQTKLETTVDVLEVENEQKDGNEVKILAVGEGREANELVEETQASDPKLRSPKSSAKQTTLSSWFGKK
uniref:Protein kinase domain-containing protein n=1 Tax=Chaetoceros debilis TaxID=122233 RepID=A0A6S8XBD2_9STRA